MIKKNIILLISVEINKKKTFQGFEFILKFLFFLLVLWKCLLKSAFKSTNHNRNLKKKQK
jgi:hypothetical protein